MAAMARSETERFLAQSRPFLEWLANWERELPVVSLEEHLNERGIGPAGTAIVAVDVIGGFCYEGPLASERAGSAVKPIAALFERAHELGVRNFILMQDTHPADAEEFGEWPPHAIAGTPEAETVKELATLPFASSFVTMPKNSINSGMATGLDAWLDEYSDVKELIAVGVVTDLCLYQLAMHLKLRSNARGLKYRVVAPADCTQTYDLPVETAKQMGVLPHPGDLLHLTFLYHLALNGVKVIKHFS